MNWNCDVWWFSRNQTRQYGTFSVVDSESMLAVSANTASVGVVHESIAITDVLEEFFDRVDGPDVVLDSILCTSDLGFANIVFRCEVWFFAAPCLVEFSRVLLDHTSLLCNLSSDFALDAR